MALTKGEIRELVRDIMDGGDSSSESKYHSLIIDKIAEIARNKVINIAYRDARKNDRNVRYIGGEFYKAYTVPVVEDTDIGRYYFELPTRIISLGKDKGLRSVTPVKEPGTTYNIVENGSEATFKGLEVEGFLMPECYLEGQRVYLRNHNKDCEQLMVRMLGSIDGLASDEIIPIPADYETDFIDLVLGLLDKEHRDNYNDANTDIDG